MLPIIELFQLLLGLVGKGTLDSLKMHLLDSI